MEATTMLKIRVMTKADVEELGSSPLGDDIIY